MRGTVEERFWAKVQKTETCWMWTAAKKLGFGYGRFRVGTSMVEAHRFSYELVHGPIAPGKFIDHTCHNPSCVNPEHLREVTHKQNMENLSGASKRSKTGIRGVTWDRERKGWRAQMAHNGKQMYLGVFPTIAEAEATAIAKRNEFFTHNNKDRY